MRISDWSSGVCSSDLDCAAHRQHRRVQDIQRFDFREFGTRDRECDGAALDLLEQRLANRGLELLRVIEAADTVPLGEDHGGGIDRSEERGVGEEGVSPCRSWWWRGN